MKLVSSQVNGQDSLIKLFFKYSINYGWESVILFRLPINWLFIFWLSITGYFS